MSALNVSLRSFIPNEPFGSANKITFFILTLCSSKGLMGNFSCIAVVINDVFEIKSKTSSFAVIRVQIFEKVKAARPFLWTDRQTSTRYGQIQSLLVQSAFLSPSTSPLPKPSPLSLSSPSSVPPPSELPLSTPSSVAKCASSVFFCLSSKTPPLPIKAANKRTGTGVPERLCRRWW